MDTHHYSHCVRSSPSLPLQDGHQGRSEKGTLKNVYKIKTRRDCRQLESSPQERRRLWLAAPVPQHSPGALTGLGGEALAWHPTHPPHTFSAFTRSQIYPRPTLIVVHAHGAISLVVGHSSTVGTVHGYLQIVGSQAVAVSVRIGKKASL